MTNTLLAKSIKDFFTKEILKLAFVPFIATMVVMYSLFFYVADYSLDALQESTLQIEQQQRSIAPDGTPHTETFSAELEGGEAILSFLLKHSITSWLLSFVVYTLGSFVVLLFSVIIALFIIGFLTPAILRIIRDRHYKDFEIEGFGHVGSIILYFIKTFAIMLVLLIVLMPLYFIPLLNIVAINLPFYYLFHKLLVYDVATTIGSEEEYKQIVYFNRNAIRFKTLMLYLLSLIPFVALLATPFFVIYLGHTFFVKLEQLRKRQSAPIEPLKSLQS